MVHNCVYKLYQLVKLSVVFIIDELFFRLLQNYLNAGQHNLNQLVFYWENLTCENKLIIFKNLEICYINAILLPFSLLSIQLWLPTSNMYNCARALGQ